MRFFAHLTYIDKYYCCCCCCWDRSCLPCTPSLCQMWFLSIIVTITSTPMALSCPKVPHPISSFLFNSVFRLVLMMFCSGWIATSLRWTQIRLRLCLLALHLVLSRSTVSAQTLAETVFLLKRRLNTLESILIKRISAEAHQQHLLCVLSRAPTYRVNPTISVPKRCSKTCWGNMTSRLDYCNSVFIGLPADQIARLQRVQNNAAWLVLKKRRRDHVTPLLKELHWLPVKFRCQYKIATLAYRHFEGSLPPYLS